MSNRYLIFHVAIESKVFDVDKPVVFSCEEIFSSTDGFSDSILLGHGTYGSVYYGILRDQVCVYLPCFPELRISVLLAALTQRI